MMEGKESPLVSIITPACNAEDYIVETVESVLSQDYPNFEYIVLDDGSTDKTLAALESYRDRLTLVSHPNMGEQRTVNKGVTLASGDIVVVVNADDPTLPGLVKTAVTVMTKRPELVAVYPDWRRIDSAGEVIAELKANEFDYDLMIEQYVCIPGPGAFFRKSALNGEAARNPAYRYLGDFDMWLRLGLRGPIARIPQTLATWRLHDAGATQAQRNPEFASNRIAVIRELFTRPDLPERVRALHRQALSTAYYAAGLLAIHNSEIPGRRYFILSFLHKPIWPRRFLPVVRRSWLRIAYVFGMPITKALFKMYTNGLYKMQKGFRK